MNKTFEDCIERKLMKDGTMHIRCKWGLWSVEGKRHKEVEHEAWRYWRLYAEDGEYQEEVRP